MSVFGDFHFLRPAWLLMLPAAGVLWWLIRRWLDPLRGWRDVMQPHLLAALTVGASHPTNDRSVLLLAGWLIATISLAGPTWKPEPSPFADDPVPVMVLLKAGESMQQADLIPSRMERARLKVSDFAEARQGQPLGLIAWAGSAHLVLPPTRDTGVVATMAAEISPDIMPVSGDNLPVALQLAAETLGDQRGSVLIVADSVSPESISQLQRGDSFGRLPVHLLAVVRPETPELTDLTAAASALNARVTLMTADSRDVDSLVKATARVPVAVADAGAGVRWSEAGWFLVPVLALMSLAAFRRVEDVSAEGLAE